MFKFILNVSFSVIMSGSCDLMNILSSCNELFIMMNYDELFLNYT